MYNKNKEEIEKVVNEIFETNPPPLYKDLGSGMYDIGCDGFVSITNKRGKDEFVEALLKEVREQKFGRGNPC